MKTITILGDGAWATTLAILLSNNRNKVILWSSFPEYLDELDSKRVNKKYLGDFIIPQEVVFEKDINKAVLQSEIIVDAIPSKFYRSVLKQIKVKVSDKIFVNVSKGIEQKTLMRMTEIIHQELGRTKTCVLSGPTIAQEIAKGMPAVAIAASANLEIAREVQKLFFNDRFRVYTNLDPVGVELCGALKNIIAIIAGISDGLGFGANSKAAILSRGIVEISRLGQVMGAQKKTFFGIAGLGDLATTCISPESRNRTFGERIGAGEKMNDIIKSTDSIIEGATTTEAVYNLSKKFNVEMPITSQVYMMLYHNKDPRKALADLMLREKKGE
ncbi:MAG: NAD(P)-dependent glycerol-3-phosphate dehydrogenase [Candidatus Pacebacteria bacterium]|nr:NAD(P)-dependent glycerol-3-phosphate dehydrogenase [Candidatus Paceibacterota bacterium]MDD3919353.1 NAD(P)-dependent glycerol-3-phosphate dehydrogenase [Candidatus Paceibacterota bacterium]